jgi:hypothetical protein
MADINSLLSIAQANGKRFEAERLLFQLMDFQNKNSFDVIFYPTYFSTDPVSAILQGASVALDQLVQRLHIQSISIPAFNTLEFENADKEQYARALTRATEITMTFIETEQSVIRNYIYAWNNLIYYYDFVKQTYIFRDDQYAAKRNCKIFLLTGIGNPSVAYLTITGMRPKSIDELTLSHEEQDPYKPVITFHCDRIDWVF